MMAFFCQNFIVQNFFNKEEFTEQNLWSLKDPKGADAKTNDWCQKIIYDKIEFLIQIQNFLALSRGLFC